MAIETTISRLLADALRADPSGPFLTFYDDATGERIELSQTTLQNWVAKTANLFVEEFDLEPGDVVTVELPPHWQAAAVVLAVALAGAEVGPAGRIAVFAEGTTPPEAEDLVGLGLRPMGGGLRTPRPGVLDYAREVGSFGDVFVPTAAADVEVGTPIADRLLTTSLDPLVDVLAGHGSLVLCRNPDVALLAERTATERVTATWGLDVPGLPRRDRP